MHQPGALDIMPITLQTACSTRPVHLKEEVEMMGLRIEYFVCEDAYDVAQGCLYPIDGLLRHRDAYREY